MRDEWMRERKRESQRECGRGKERERESDRARENISAAPIRPVRLVLQEKESRRVGERERERVCV